MEEIEYLLTGKSGRTVIFLNGFRMPFDSWDKVYPSVGEQHTTLLYNRRGIGKSKKAASPQSGEVIVTELRALLKVLNLKPPYVLVGHSLGGIFANLFARKYPLDVESIVFVESSHPNEIRDQQSIPIPKVLNVINRAIKRVEQVFDQYRYSEEEQALTTLAELESAGSFPQIPIAVISGAKKMPLVPKESFLIHQQYQKELLALSSDALHYQCYDSGHFPQITEPRLVFNTIIETISRLAPLK